MSWMPAGGMLLRPGERPAALIPCMRALFGSQLCHNSIGPSMGVPVILHRHQVCLQLTADVARAKAGAAHSAVSHTIKHQVRRPSCSQLNGVRCMRACLKPAQDFEHSDPTSRHVAPSDFVLGVLYIPLCVPAPECPPSPTSPCSTRSILPCLSMSVATLLCTPGVCLLLCRAHRAWPAHAG
jgi:hypothetical protein